MEAAAVAETVGNPFRDRPDLQADVPHRLVDRLHFHAPQLHGLGSGSFEPDIVCQAAAALKTGGSGIKDWVAIVFHPPVPVLGRDYCDALN
jgi:hypothetical protein